MRGWPGPETRRRRWGTGIPGRWNSTCKGPELGGSPIGVEGREGSHVVDSRGQEVSEREVWG